MRVLSGATAPQNAASSHEKCSLLVRKGGRFDIQDGYPEEAVIVIRRLYTCCEHIQSFPKSQAQCEAPYLASIAPSHASRAVVA
jgi:hypothetical protein